MAKQFRLFDHSADTGLELESDTIEELFEAAAEGMISIIASVDNVSGAVDVKVNVTAGSLEDLLMEWLREILFIFATQHYIFSKFLVDIKEQEGTFQLNAVCSGDRLNTDKHTVHTEIKSVTYHELFVKKSKANWQGRVIFDL